MKAAIIAHWSGTVPGREKDAFALRLEIDEFFGKLVAEGRIDDAAWFLGTEGPSYYIVRGDDAALREIEATPEAQMLILKSGMVNESFGYGHFLTGDAADALFEGMAHLAQELHYA